MSDDPINNFSGIQEGNADWAEVVNGYWQNLDQALVSGGKYLRHLNVDNGVLLVDSTNHSVGIGTNSPVAKLDVDADASFNKSKTDKDFSVWGTDTVNKAIFIDASENNAVFFGGVTLSSEPEILLTDPVGGYYTSFSRNSTGPRGFEMKQKVAVSGYDDYTKLMLHCDGTHGSTTFTDVSNSAHTVTRNGNVYLSTAQKKFGTASALFDGTSDYLSVTSNDFAYGTGPFTVDCWLYPVTFATIAVVYSQGGSNGAGAISIFTSGLLTWYSGGVRIQDNVPLLLNTWTHVAVVGSGGAGRTVKMYKNGQQVGSTWTYNYDYTQTTIWIGANQSLTSECMNGYIDEFRISKGVARWDSNFTPPTEAYGAALPIEIQALSYTDSGTTGAEGLLTLGSHASETVIDGGNIFFQIAGIEKIRVNTEGYLGLNTSSASALLDVDGNAIFNKSKADKDFTVWATDATDKALFVDASAQTINFGNTIIGFGKTNTDYTLTFDGESNDGLITWMEDEDYFKFSDDILMNANERVYLRDTDISISSIDDGHLDLTADSSIDLNGAVVSNSAKADKDLTVWGTDATYPLLCADAGNNRIGIGTNNPAVKLDVAGASRLGDSTSNYVDIDSTGNLSFQGSAGFHPRKISQNDQPTLSTGELAIWQDTDDSNKVYLLYNDSVQGHVKIQLG